MKEPFLSIDPYKIEKDVDVYRRAVNKCLRSPFIKNNDGVSGVAQEIFDSVEKFKPKMPIVTSLANEGMRERHWNALSDKLGVELNR
eukprot:TRINITY_DN10356_c0_g1_i1.p1 TRINITY_DN10356_c0_g1~~TRINITY_DN10356_c0_g1_i1.p1  ORF type:complete len:102 (-),score=6.51 TRINITY_DN10356_c0_g1_i1:286-546(-)